MQSIISKCIIEKNILSIKISGSLEPSSKVVSDAGAAKAIAPKLPYSMGEKIPAFDLNDSKAPMTAASVAIDKRKHLLGS